VQKPAHAPAAASNTSMACPRCGSDCSCACSGDPIPSQDWRRQVSLQVRAHKVRKHHRLDPNAPQLEFDDHTPLQLGETSASAMRSSSWRWDEGVVASAAAPGPPIAVSTVQPSEPEMEVHHSRKRSRPPDLKSDEASDSMAAAFSERPPLAPFPRISAAAPKIIEFPRVQPRHYELAEPVVDQLRIFEAVEELSSPQPNHLNDIEIAPAEPMHVGLDELEIPLQTAPIEQRAYAAAVDAAILIGAMGLFGITAEFFANSLPMTKPLLESIAISGFLLLTIYYVLSLSLGRGTAGMQASGLRVTTFLNETPSRNLMRCRALATVLSYAAMGMGFAWALIDEDRLCWHDRITHTYLTSK
jgi:uncharacterized RDD family membrane protein YckC